MPELPRYFLHTVLQHLVNGVFVLVRSRLVVSCKFIELGESQTRATEFLKVLKTQLLYQNVCLMGVTTSACS